MAYWFTVKAVSSFQTWFLITDQSKPINFMIHSYYIVTLSKGFLAEAKCSTRDSAALLIVESNPFFWSFSLDGVTSPESISGVVSLVGDTWKSEGGIESSESELCLSENYKRYQKQLKLTISKDVRIFGHDTVMRKKGIC